MFRNARETGPVVLVPLAWAFVTAAHIGIVDSYTLFVAHVVMSVLLAAFAVTSWREMSEGVLWAWRTVIAVGFLITVAGTVGFRVEESARVLFSVALYGWMLLPAAGFVYTGRRVQEGAWIYFGGAVLCGLGAVGYALGVATGTDPALAASLALVGVGQTAGIADAVYRY
ncbi:hypothetical protein [Natronomonas gomsonensis]|uniref:hypothetical protein n=1 Tax=Natronomonas gomsonensis TaxID=1046043 RepID=UPI0015C1A487|nr:hypothetical protein [Natronomonas gomsonensis]